jgi:hypothetical protein
MVATVARLQVQKTSGESVPYYANATRLLNRDFAEQNRLKNRFDFVASNGAFL